jgi:hypothetical protein
MIGDGGRPEIGDLAIAAPGDLARHVAARGLVADADGGGDRVPVDIHHLDHRNTGIGHHGARGLGMFEPATIRPEGRQDSIS